jgi:predicted transcriptional regulator
VTTDLSEKSVPDIITEETMPAGRKNRGWIEITGLILSECRKGAVKTRVMYACNLNSKQIQQYLAFLLEYAFLEKRRESNRLTPSYHTTKLGLKFLEIYEQLEDVLEKSSPPAVS